MNTYSAILTLALTIDFTSALGQTSAETSPRAQIINGCSAKAEQKKSVKQPRRLCECIARKHIDASTQEPDPVAGRRQLNWVIAYYGTNDPRQLSTRAKQMPFMIDFDFGVVEDCSARN